MDDRLRESFDAMFDAVMAQMPQDIHRLIEEIPLIVEDHPSPEIAEEFELEYLDELCGLHDGIPLTERSVDGGQASLPDHIMIYREGILSSATDDDGHVDMRELHRQIRITILHEIGHHFGLDEDDLEKLGYG